MMKGIKHTQETRQGKKVTVIGREKTPEERLAELEARVTELEAQLKARGT